MSEFPEGFRPVVLTAEETAKREAEKQAQQQNSQAQTVLQDGTKTIQVNKDLNQFREGDVIVEQPTILDIATQGTMETDTNVYVVDMKPHTNDLTGQTEIVAQKAVVQGTPEEDLGMQMIYNPTNN